MIRTAGNITYELTLKRIRNINLRVAGGAVKVSAPYGADREFIDRFVLSKRDIICAALARSEKIHSAPDITVSRETVYGRLYGIYEEIYKRFLKYGFPLPELRIRKMTSQWGNCRRERGIVTLNAYLYGLPDECIELVAAHELSHMVQPNHSAAFYAVLADAMPDWRQRDAMLKRWRPE